jgi:hypothetical protein
MTLSWVLPVLLLGAPPKDAPPPRAEQEKLLAERSRYAIQVAQLRSRRMVAEAITALRKKLAVERKIFGIHSETAGSLELLARLHQERGDFAAARKAQKEVVALWTKLHDARHWRVTDARLALNDLKREAQLKPSERALLKKVRESSLHAYDLWQAGRVKEALPLYRRTLGQLRRLLGKEHSFYPRALSTLAAVHEALGGLGEAQRLFRRAVRYRKRSQGEQHPESRKALIDYCRVSRQQAARQEAADDFDSARQNYQEVLEGYLQLFGARHWRVTDVRLKLADIKTKARLNPGELAQVREAQRLNSQVYRLYQAKKYREALPLARKAMVTRGRLLGKDHPDYALSVFNLGSQLLELGRFREATALYRQALEIIKRVQGEKNPLYRDLLIGVSRLWARWARADRVAGDFPAAARAQEEVLAAMVSLYGKKDWRVTDARIERDTARLLARLTPEERAQLAKAATLYRQAFQLDRRHKPKELLLLAGRALAIQSRLLGKGHRDTLQSLSLVVVARFRLGQITEAIRLYRPLIQARKRLLGEDHPFYREDLEALGLALKRSARQHLLREDFRAARRDCQETFEIWSNLRGANYWRARDAKLALANVDHLAKLDRRQRRRLREADALHIKCKQQLDSGNFPEAVATARKIVTVRRELLGEKHAEYAQYPQPGHGLRPPE